jgi:DNA-binding MarR family transcriptional regulator
MKDRDLKKRDAWRGKFGEKHASSKLKDSQRIEIASKYKTGRYTQSELAKEYKVDQGLISKITKTF